MELRDARILVAGAGGAVGQALVERLTAGGARVHRAGRGVPPAAVGWSAFDITDPAGVRRLVADALAALGGLDALVISVGVPAFGPAEELGPDVHRTLMAVNATGPMDLIAAALPHLPEGGAVVVMSAILADHPTAGMAAYSAAKAALGAYLTAVRREVRRRRITVLDVRAPHLATRFGERALTGIAPEMPAALGVDALADAVATALADRRGVLRWDLRARELVASAQ